MNAPGESWLELLRASQAGDDDALASFLTRLYVRVTERMLRESSIRRQLAGETAEDIAAATIERVAGAYSRCEATSDAEVLAWAYRIAANVATDHFRSSASRIFLRCVADSLEDLEAGVDLSAHDDSPLEPDELALVHAVMREYNRLPPAAAELLWQRLIERPSWQATAMSCNTTESGARRRYQRTIARLRRLVRRVMDDLPAEQREAAQRALARRVSPRARR